MLTSVFSTARNALYVAEIGLNHNGDMKAALAMISAAARAGTDAVKFQTFVPELMISPYADDLLGSGSERIPDQSRVEFFRRFVFNQGQYRELQAAAASEGIVFFSSVFDEPSVEMLQGLDVPLYKLASSEVTNLPLIGRVAKTGRPAILSTGMAGEEEIAAAVKRFRESSKAELVLLHCVSLYPAPADEMNLSRISSLARRFGLPVGFSDHARDASAPMLAAAAGARLFEKHFTIDRFYECPDKDVSSTPEEFAALITSVETAVTMMGSGDIRCSESEQRTARSARRSIFARRPISAGSVIGEADLVALRPGTGIPAHDLERVLGKTSRVDIPLGFMIRREYLAGEE